MRTSLSLAAFAALLSGCVGAALETGRMSADKVKIGNNIEAARAGDAVAQFKVGEAYCCSLGEGEGIYDTKLSVRWLCQSAAQGYGPAMYKLGKIYSGDVIDGVRLIRRVAQGVAGNSESFPVAYRWFTLAEGQGVAEAKDRAKGVWREMSPAEHTRVAELAKTDPVHYCRWEDVFAGS